MARQAEITDNFNRSDQNLQVSSDWVAITGLMVVNNNECSTTQNDSEYLNSVDISEADSYTQAVIPATNPTNTSPGLFARMSSNGLTGYLTQIRPTHSSFKDWLFYRRVNGTYTLLVDGSFRTMSAGGTFRLEVETINASTVQLRGYFNDEEQEVYNDTNAARITSAGRSGLRGAVGARFDNYEAGILYGSSTETNTIQLTVDSLIAQRTQKTLTTDGIIKNIDWVSITVDCFVVTPTGSLGGRQRGRGLATRSDRVVLIKRW